MSDVGRYRKLYPRLWRHPGFVALRPSVRELVIYLLTGPQTNSIGLFHFSVATAAEDMNVSVETLRKGLADVAVTFGWGFDADARVFYIPSWWRWNQPENLNVLKGNLKALSEIPPCALVDAFARNLETLPETLHETFVEGIRIRMAKRPPNQEQYQEHLSGAFKEHEPALRAKDGSDRSAFLLPVARQVLNVTNPDAPIDHLLDTFYQLKPKGCSRQEATHALNVALSELREGQRAS